MSGRPQPLAHQLAAARQDGGCRHPRFGPLLDHGAIRLPAGGQEPPEPFTPAMIHLTVTGRCQARCHGCINHTVSRVGDPSPLAGLESDPARDARAVATLAARSRRRPVVVCFYGGEPLLALERMQAVMDRLGHGYRYMLYTNGMELERAVDRAPEFFRALWLVSVSVDGDRAQHERWRRGTDFHRIIKGIEALRPVTPARILFWSTLREGMRLAPCTDTFAGLWRRGLVDLFFHHWEETAAPFADFPAFLAGYQEDLTALLTRVRAELAEGRFLPVVHLAELLCFCLTGMRRATSACGVEEAENFDIAGGRVYPCSDLPAQYAIGAIDQEGRVAFTEYDLADLVAYKEELGCRRCGVHGYCGGRCPVQASFASGRRLLQYCQLMRLHVGVVLDHLEAITAGLEGAGFTGGDLYRLAGRFAQFTDVTP